MQSDDYGAMAVILQTLERRLNDYFAYVLQGRPDGNCVLFYYDA